VEKGDDPLGAEPLDAGRIISQQKELVHACEESEVSLARSQCFLLKKQVLEALLAGSRDHPPCPDP
jgi:hypothetical protein